VPRGRALGYTLNLPAEDRYLKTREELLDYMTVLLGGRVAEQVVFGAITTGASDDLKRVADIAHSMVHDFAMGTAGVGRSPDGDVRLSETTLRIRDEERQDMIEEARRAAQRMIASHRRQLDALARELLEREVLERDTIERIMDGVPRLERAPGVGLRVVAAVEASGPATGPAPIGPPHSPGPAPIGPPHSPGPAPIGPPPAGGEGGPARI
jgi:cell division protease FtsH